MLRIPNSQIDAIAASMNKDFPKVMAIHLFDKFSIPIRTQTDFNNLVLEVKEICGLGRSFGLAGTNGMYFHVLLAYVVGIDYPEKAALAPMLNDSEVPADLKALFLERWSASLAQRATLQRPLA